MNIDEMQDQSPRRFGQGSIEVEASPMSNIVNDLGRSSLSPSGAKKRHPQAFRDVFGTSHRTNNQRNEGFFQSVRVKNRCPSTRTNADLILGLDLEQNPDGLSKRDEKCDKENDNTANLSYNSSSQKVRCKKARCPLQECELNKQMSDYEIELVDDKEETRRGAAVSRCMSMDSRYIDSPVESPQSMVSNSRDSLLHLEATRSAILRRLSSGYESMDDGLMNELIDMETMDDETQLPSDISKLLSGDIVAPEASVECDVSTTPEFSRSKVSAKVSWLSNRCLQNQLHKREATIVSPPLSKIRTCLFRSPTTTCSSKLGYDERAQGRTYCIEGDSPLSTRSCKRPSEELSTDEIAILKKSRKSNSFCINAIPELVSSPRPLAHPKFQRSLSENEAHIKWAVHRSITDSDLIGDFSKPCVLPLTDSNHADLKCITTDTLAALLRGEFADRVGSYKIVDCRYPYEYDAGHIEAALNLYNKDLVERILLEPLDATVPEIQSDINKRHVLVFHCEFSWERGPNLSRFLRSLDRQRNKEQYPALYYPEIYLLHGGYEKFYREQREFCSPQEYKPMRHPDHTEECKHFRSKSKSWQGDKSKGNSTQTGRQNLKRLGF
ncbi:M-phase inducer phosphatase isoform X1 [Ooceraea biroi]|uniref:M-phase inducer phosphatase isoform X1 n=1 Tax=Ooceraea biroi TaxID=2015173 RepID=UPI000F086542|nr:M-phase inducer phosphatase isoform X1 [Ooceraea biroi]XP_011352234.2 M-phase inducer phosphatase isoform X1 [Ooceraea biroi]